MWYGKDIVESIARCPTRQEIASHSFSHFVAGDQDFTEEAFESDLRQCHEVAAATNLNLRSYVFPRNSIGHESVLAKHGFRAFRGKVGVTSSRESSILRKWAGKMIRASGYGQQPR